MTGNITLDVAIGLFFIYTVYSLFTCISIEIISSNVKFRAFCQKFAIRKMLDDLNAKFEDANKQRNQPPLFEVYNRYNKSGFSGYITTTLALSPVAPIRFDFINEFILLRGSIPTSSSNNIQDSGKNPQE